jgi:hypothetical protein
VHAGTRAVLSSRNRSKREIRDPGDVGLRILGGQFRNGGIAEKRLI